MAGTHKAAKAVARMPRAKPKAARARRAPKPLVIDFHAHVVVPEVLDLCKDHTVSGAIPADPRIPEKARMADLKWREKNARKYRDFKERLRDMDRMGVDVQVLTPAIVGQNFYWAEPEEGLRIARLLNDRVAELVAIAPARFVGLGNVPLQSPLLAVGELERCMKQLGLRGAEISSNAHTMELGDPRMRTFWAAAEKLRAVIFVHPAGVADPRYQKYQLWNSVGQSQEEAMAICSLFYEGVLDTFPKLKICVAHGGGFLPVYSGRVDRNYKEKQTTRFNMSKSPSQYMRRHFWYDTCLYNPEELENLVRKVGASRIVMGSDYPVGEADPVGFVRHARGLSAAERADILGGNAARLLGLRGRRPE